MTMVQAGQPATFGAWTTQRLSVLLRPRRAPEECEGICNPGGAAGLDGTYYLFPRCVGPGNYSRIGLARVLRGPDGVPVGAQRLGYALEPAVGYDDYGCEDARVTWTRELGYVMVYVALGQSGPRLALATSVDLASWTRAGLVAFSPRPDQPDLGAVPNKDGMLFPEPVRAPDGHWSLCLLHRPMTGPGALCVWLSYARLCDLRRRGRLCFGQPHLLARGQESWEADRIGGGAVPVLTPAGWLVLYHGVSYGPAPVAHAPETDAVLGKVYVAGALLLDRHDPRQIVARSARPIFGPKELYERCGTMPNVVFPTAIEPDVRSPGFYYVYYGAADYYCAALRLGPRGEDLPC